MVFLGIYSFVGLRKFEDVLRIFVCGVFFFWK